MMRRSSSSQHVRPISSSTVTGCTMPKGSLMPLLVMQLVVSKSAAARTLADSSGSRQKSVKVSGRVLFSHDSKIISSFWKIIWPRMTNFAGTFSFADIQMAFPLQALQSRTGGKYPQIERYLQRLAQREGYQRAFAREQKLEAQLA